MLKTIPELRDAVVNPKAADPASSGGPSITTVRVDLRHVEQLKFEARTHDGFSIYSDEPTIRGGTNFAPSSLNYFVFGAASCFLSQMTKVCIMKNLKVDSIEITARGHVDRRKRKFTEFIYDVRLTGSEARDNLTDLLHLSEEMCFVHQTLKDAIPLTSNVSLNGNPVASHRLEPES